jgi:pimeloyl-ACP methyl ester carboxylesterase
MSPFGTFDMAGNVREWCINATGTQRYILGGGWNDPSYQFTDAHARDPFDRSGTNGFRLVSYLSDSPNLALAMRPLERRYRDFSREQPVSDALFESFRRMYDYDRTALNATVESRDSTEDWVRERVSFDAAYGGERVPAFVYLPRTARPPFQTVIFFPGSGAQSLRSTRTLANLWTVDFVIRSGRALVYPIYKGTYERRDTLIGELVKADVMYRDHVLMWAKDVRRSLDYLATRGDIDTTRLAYVGVSWGGYLGGIFPAIEPRIRAAALLGVGLQMEPARPEAEPVNFLPRITVPVLMLNGKHDHFYPSESSQKPFYQLLGTPAAHKRYVLNEGGHLVPRTMYVTEVLNWLDKYLGPVR